MPGELDKSSSQGNGKRVSVSHESPQPRSQAPSALRRNSTPIELVDSILAEYGSPVRTPKANERNNSGIFEGDKEFLQKSNTSSFGTSNEEVTKSALKKSSKLSSKNTQSFADNSSPSAHSDSFGRLPSPEASAKASVGKPPAYGGKPPSGATNKQNQSSDDISANPADLSATNDPFAQFRYGSAPINVKAAVTQAREERLHNINYDLLQQGLLSGISGSASQGGGAVGNENNVTDGQSSNGLRPNFVSSLSATAPPAPLPMPSINSNSTSIPMLGTFSSGNGQPQGVLGTVTTIGNIISEQRHPLYSVINAGRSAINTPISATPKPEGEEAPLPDQGGFEDEKNSAAAMPLARSSGSIYGRPPAMSRPQSSSRPFGSGSKGSPYLSMSNNESFQSVSYPTDENGNAMKTGEKPNTVYPTPLAPTRSFSIGGAGASLLNSEFNHSDSPKKVPHAAADMLDKSRQAIDSMQIPLQYKMSGYAPLHRTVQMLLSALTILAADVRQNSTEVNKLDAKLSSETFKSNHHTAFVKKTLEDYASVSRLEKMEERVNARLDSVMEKLSSTSTKLFQSCEILGKRIDGTINDVISIKAKLDSLETKNDKATAAHNAAQLDVIAANKSDLAAAIHQLADELKKTKSTIHSHNHEYKRELAVQGESIATIQKDFAAHTNALIGNSESIDRLNTEFSKKVSLLDIEFKNVNTQVTQLSTEHELFSAGLGNDVRNLQREQAVFSDRIENNLSHVHNMLDTRLVNLKEDVLFTQNELANTKSHVQALLKSEKTATAESIQKIEAALTNANNKISMLTTLQTETEANIDQSLSSFESNVRVYTKEKIATLSNSVAEALIETNKYQMESQQSTEKRIVAVGKMIAGLGYLLNPTYPLSSLASIANKQTISNGGGQKLPSATASHVVQNEINLVVSRLARDDDATDTASVDKENTPHRSDSKVQNNTTGTDKKSDPATIADFITLLKSQSLRSSKVLPLKDTESSNIIPQNTIADPVASLLSNYYQNKGKNGEDYLYFYPTGPTSNEKGLQTTPKVALAEDVARYKMLEHLEENLWNRKNLLVVSTKQKPLDRSLSGQAQIESHPSSPQGSLDATFISPKSGDGEGNEGLRIRVANAISTSALTAKSEVQNFVSEKIQQLSNSLQKSNQEMDEELRRTVNDIVDEKVREAEGQIIKRWREVRQSKETTKPEMISPARTQVATTSDSVDPIKNEEASANPDEQPLYDEVVYFQNQSLLATGIVRPQRGTLISLLGIEVIDSQPSAFGSNSASYSPSGVIVARLLTSGPSYHAGIVEGDLIVAVNHQEVTNLETFIAAIELPTLAHTPYVRLIVRRGNDGALQSIRVSVTK